jgi:Mn-dependent DtxR family transcriptional regulator
MGERGRIHAIRVLWAIKRYFDDNGYAPTYREIADELGINQVQVLYSVKTLERVGIIEKSKGKHRAIRLTPENINETLLKNL